MNNWDFSFKTRLLSDSGRLASSKVQFTQSIKYKKIALFTLFIITFSSSIIYAARKNTTIITIFWRTDIASNVHVAVEKECISIQLERFIMKHKKIPFQRILNYLSQMFPCSILKDTLCKKKKCVAAGTILCSSHTSKADGEDDEKDPKKWNCYVIIIVWMVP